MIKALVQVISWLLAIFCTLNLFMLIPQLAKNLSINHVGFLVGTLISLFIIKKYKKQLSFFIVFEHELTHNIWAMLFFMKPMGFHVKEDGTGGYFVHSANGNTKLKDIFIRLSPYFFPTACFLWIPFCIVWKEEYLLYYFSIMGVFWGYHIMSTIQETGSHQSDLRAHGLTYSYLLILPLYIIFNGIIIALLNNGFSGIIDFLLFNSIDTTKDLINFLNKS